jgi:DnaA family protein
VRQLPLEFRLKDSAIFATFHPGPNELVVAYLRALADGDGTGCWLWGAAGCGKSHLLQGLCAAAAEKSRRAAYLPMTQIGPLGPEALNGWGEHDIVAVDELDAAVGNKALEAGLFRLYNELHDSSAIFVVASRLPPGSLEFRLPDLRSRLAAGSVFQLAALDDSDAIEALKCRARHRGLELPRDTARYLMRRLPRDMDSLCDWLDRLDVASLVAQRRLTIPFVREVLAVTDGHDP